MPPPPTAKTKEVAAPITLFTIGFSGKTARQFFQKIQSAGVKRVIDIRLHNVSQLAGFTKKNDLQYFLRSIAAIDYLHYTDLAPSPELFDSYKKRHEIDWPEYERRFNKLLVERRPEAHHPSTEFHEACLLCTEPTPANCHRRLLAEYLQNKWTNLTIHHL